MAQSAPVQPGENPLVPNAILRELHTLMVAIRRSPLRSTKGGCPHGAEAVYASSLLSLRAGDLVTAESGQPPAKNLPLRSMPTWLSLDTASAYDRLVLALGSAAALRAQSTASLVLAHAVTKDLRQTQWQHVLGIAGKLPLPIVFIVLPDKRPGLLSSHAQNWGVPGIPVDAADAVALYRVLQESTLRARNGDGPVLVEPIPWTLGLASGQPADPLRSLQKILRLRGLLPLPSEARAARRPAATPQNN